MSKDASFYYGSQYDDEYLMSNSQSLPRYGNLVRKVMMHYLGDRYNPHTHGLAHEPFLRQMVKEIVAHKVFYRRPSYDWDWIDQSFRKYFSQCFGLDISYDQSRIDRGFVGLAKAPKQPRHITMH